MKYCLVILFFLGAIQLFAQPLAAKLDAALKQLEKDAQFKHTIVSMYVADSKTGKPVFAKNEEVGLAPASCQKVVTSVSAFEMLGKDFTYKTTIGHTGTLENGTLTGNFIIKTYGDPTFGSWRWEKTSAASLQKILQQIFTKTSLRNIYGNIVFDESAWNIQATPDGWIWEDVGNYYGAGARALNWHENQYDLVLNPGKKEGDEVQIFKTEPELNVTLLKNELKTGKEGSGDNSVIYLPEEGMIGYIRGTVPAGKVYFTVKGSLPSPSRAFLVFLEKEMEKARIYHSGRMATSTLLYQLNEVSPPIQTELVEIRSPVFDSMNYWFLKKSINLYGEAFVKTIAYEKKKVGDTDTGISLIKSFWQQKGIDPSALNIIDGSGLSPANRVTTHALVTVMQYAQKQPWFSSFYNALPDMNGIKMKDGYINGVRSYTGYIKSKAGQEYSFSFIVNNFDGNSATVREKMWKVLDILK